MSQPSRAERRRQTRGGASAPPPRDPMRAVYIGIGIGVVIIVGVFGFIRWNEQRQHDAALAVMVNTPAPSPSASAKPILLHDGTTVGAVHWKVDPRHTPLPLLPDTSAGGTGQTVDGVECAAGMTEFAQLHVHPHLALFVNGKQIAIPNLIGFTATPNIAGGGCLYWIHTHDASGIIHIEAPKVSPNDSGPYTLGILFDIWGQPLTRDNVAGFKGPVTAYVNGTQYDGDLKAIPLSAHNQIVLEVGTPVPPPVYAFPAEE